MAIHRKSQVEPVIHNVETKTNGLLVIAKQHEYTYANKFKFNNQDINTYYIMHIAMHAFFHPEYSGLPSLVFSSFNEEGLNQTKLLRAIDISQLQHNHDLVVLSGCETGIDNLDAALGLNGSTDSFMQAGVKNLVASLWQVDDRITQKLMAEFYNNHKKGMSTSKSLWHAQKIIKNNPRANHPKYWAGWFLISN